MWQHLKGKWRARPQDGVGWIKRACNCGQTPDFLQWATMGRCQQSLKAWRASGSAEYCTSWLSSSFNHAVTSNLDHLASQRGVQEATLAIGAFTAASAAAWHAVEGCQPNIPACGASCLASLHVACFSCACRVPLATVQAAAAAAVVETAANETEAAAAADLWASWIYHHSPTLDDQSCRTYRWSISSTCTF